jgi:hypothetical protein
LHIVYVDDSRDEAACVFSALYVPAETWREAFDRVKEFRRALKRSDGIYVYKELHAWKFISGRGRVGERIVPKARRREICIESLRLTASLPGVKLFNAVFGPRDDVRAFERLLNRINRTLSASRLVELRGPTRESGRRSSRRRCRRLPPRFLRWSVLCER